VAHRTNFSTYQLAVIANDFQVPFHDEKALLLFKLFLRRERPDWLILNGDFQDFWEISRYDQTPRTGKEFREEIDLGKKILRSFRRSLPRARITWIEGNHEFRLRKYLIQNAKELYGLPRLSVQDIFDLDRLGIEYVPCHEMATKFSDNFIRVGGLYVGHWDKVSKHGAYAAKLLVEEKGVSLLQGHTHRFGVHARTTVDSRLLLGIENFSMCSRRQSYVSHANWQLGFSAVYFQPSSDRFHWFPIIIGKDYRFVWRNQEYGLAGVRRLRRSGRDVESSL
jgi:UDP-2,3-diacylglucosamine pyrophosphatase LpxH